MSEDTDRFGTRYAPLGVVPAATGPEDGEEILEIPGHDGYFATSKGRIGSTRIPGSHRRATTDEIRWLKPYPHPKWKYLYVDIRYSDGRRHNARVNVLVLMTFAGPPPEGMECCHEDGDRTNNAIGNLYYGTRSQNMEDAARHGTLSVGVKQPAAKLNDTAVGEILRGVREGVPQSFYVRKYGVSSSVISCVVSRKSWKHVKEAV